MDYEKRYKEALERAIVAHKDEDRHLKATLERIFPELVESEDERIRNVLIELVKGNESCGHFMINNITTSSMIAWLEKQGKQNSADMVEPKFKVKYAGSEYNVLEVKDIAGVTYYKIEDEPNHIDYILPDNCEIVGGYSIKENGSPYPTKPAKFSEQKTTNKVEPKFHEGEWLCENEPNNYARYIQILETVNVQGKERYRISRDIHNDDDIVAFDFVEKYYHKFDIKDAKDGDLLVSLFNRPFIYNGHFDTFKVGAYCGLNCTGEDFLIANELCHWTNNDNIKPATKEQRDQLEEAMAYAGYRWKAETKELIKVTKPKESTGELIDEEKSWSEEDEKHLIKCLETLIAQTENVNLETIDKEWKPTIDWLKQLKYRIGG